MSIDVDKKRKLESVARLLIGATTDGEFDVALRRARELAEKTGVSLKQVMLANLNISLSVQKRNEIYELEDEIRDLKKEAQIFRDENKKVQEENLKLHGRIRRYTKKIDELEDKLRPKKERKDKLEGFRERYIQSMHTLDKSIKNNSDLRSEISQLKKQLNQTKERIPIISKNLVNDFAKRYRFEKDKKSWISSQTLYKKALLYFEDHTMSIKRFSMEFGNSLGIKPVIGGKNKKNKGFNVRCPVIASED